MFEPDRSPLPRLDAVWSDGTRILVAGPDSIAELRDGAVTRHPIEGWVSAVRARGADEVFFVGGHLEQDEYDNNATRGRVWRFDGSGVQRAFAPVPQFLLALAWSPERELIAVGGNAALYAADGSVHVRETNGRLLPRATGGAEALVGVEAVGSSVLLLGATHITSDAGESWGTERFVLRVSTASGVRAVARGDFGANALFATSFTNVFVAGDSGALMHRCGGTPLDALTTPERVVHRGDGNPVSH